MIYILVLLSVGRSKLAWVLHGYAERLQAPERLMVWVAQSIWNNSKPQGVTLVIEAQHGRMLGCFLGNPDSRNEVLSLMNKR